MEIFKRIRLDSTQARSVAELRFGDAEALIRESRPNGAIYMAGLAIELLLKALLLDKNPQIAKKSKNQVKGKEQELWVLCYEKHDLGALFGEMPDVKRKLGSNNMLSYNVICKWTIYVRYSDKKASMMDARDFVSRVKELKPWLN